MSFLHAMFSLGAGLGAASGYLAARHGISVDVHYLVAGLLLGGGCLAASAVPWSSPALGDDRRAAFVLPRGNLALVGAVAFCATLSEGAVADWSAMFLHEASMVSEAQAALGYAAFSAAMVVMRLLGDRVVDRWGPRWSARFSGMTAAAGVMTVVFGHDLYVVLTGFVLMGIGYANIAPLAFSRAGVEPTMSAGAAIASVATFGYGGLLLGPAVIGWVAGATSLAWAFGLLAVLAVLIGLLGRSLDTPGATRDQAGIASKRPARAAA
jgi:MFS family permease